MSLSPEQADAAKEVMSYCGGKVADWGLGIFREKVIERWSKRRAEEFFKTFAAVMVDPEAPADEVRNKLNAIMADARHSEAMFEAYRAVCLCKSKTLGPRCIALLTARIIGEKREATPKEEQWGQAYEMLSDVELGDLSRYYFEKFRLAKDSNKEHLLNNGLLTVVWYTDDIEEKEEIVQSPLNLFDALGSWGPRLQQLGMIETVSSQKEFTPRLGSGNPFTEERTYYRLKQSILLQESDLPCVNLIRTATELTNE